MGRRARRARSSSSTCRPTFSSACRTWKPTAAWNAEGSGRRGEDDGRSRDEPATSRAGDAVAARIVAAGARPIDLRADRRAVRRARLRHLLGTPLRAQSRRRQLPPRRLRARQGACATRRTRRCGGRRTWCAKPTCAAASTRSSPAASSRSRSSPSSAPFTPRSSAAIFPAMTDDELASLAAPLQQADADAVLLFQAVVAIGLRGRQSRPGLLRAALGSPRGGRPARTAAALSCRCVARYLRDKGTHRSTAEVIEGVRLARTLSALHDGLAPTLRDLRDAAVTLIGHGELSTVSEALSHVDVGTAIGELPKGVSQTSIQSDFERELGRLKLEKYKTTVKQELTLDLRENRRVKSEEAAFLDLHRSSFFHRLRMLGVGFATPAASPTSNRRPGRRNGSCNGAPKARSPWSRRSCSARRSSWRPASSSRRQLEACTIDRRGGRPGQRRLPVRPDGVDGPGPPPPAGTGRRQHRVQGDRPCRLPAQPGGALRRRPQVRSGAARCRSWRSCSSRVRWPCTARPTATTRRPKNLLVVDGRTESRQPGASRPRRGAALDRTAQDASPTPTIATRSCPATPAPRCWSAA